jgi:hypothetical protein
MGHAGAAACVRLAMREDILRCYTRDRKSPSVAPPIPCHADDRLPQWRFVPEAETR